MNIKKQIAKILAVVMFFSSLQNVSLFSLKAAEKPIYNFQLLQKILSEENPGLKEALRGDGDDDTALAQWEMSAAGEYVLEYYIQDGNQTKKVAMKFEYEGDKIEMLGTIEDTPSLSVTQRIFETDKWINESTIKNEIKSTFDIGTSAQENREYSAVVNNLTINQENLTIRVKIDKSGAVPVIQYYTNGIEKGYVNEFTLKKVKADGTDEASTKEQFFNGPKNFTIMPVHLETKSTTSGILSVTHIDNISEITPGSRPGIKVSFDPIQYINDNGDFTEPKGTGSTGSIVNAQMVSIRLAPQYSLTDTNTAGDGSMGLRFYPIDSQDVFEVTDPTQSIGKVMKEGDQLSIYLAKPLTDSNESFHDAVIEWNTLTPSMVVIGTFSLHNDSNQYRPENKGHTYLKYTLSKANNNQVKFTIEPYNINSKATYTISSSEWKDASKFNEKVIYEYDPSKTNNKEITAVVDNANVNYYKIEVKIDGQIYSSQVVKYDPNSFVVQPSIPTIKTIENIYVVPDDEDTSHSAYPLAIGFDLTWSAPDNLDSLLSNGDLYYELLLREDKNDKDPLNTPHLAGTDGYAAYSKIFKVSQGTEGKIVEVATKPNGEKLGTAGQKDSADEAEEKLKRYNQSKNEFTMENISLMDLRADLNKWEEITFPSGYSYNSSKEYLNEGMTVGDTLSSKAIPGTYYLSLRTIYVPKDKDKTFTYSIESNLESISLDLVNEIVPVPVNVTTEPVTSSKDAVVEKVTFDYVNIESYVKKMIHPAGLWLSTDKTEKYNGEYIFYLYQDEKALTEANVESVAVKDQTFKPGDQIDLTSSDIKTLRNGGVIAVKVKIKELLGGGKGTIQFKGLDSNQVYYLQLRTKLSPEGENGDVDPRTSLLSKIFTFTTSADLIPPTPDDKKPTTPRDFTIVEDSLTKNSVKLQWKVADFEKDSDVSKTYYELVRADKHLSDEQKALSIEELVNANKKWVGFSSFNPASEDYNAVDYMMSYDGDSKAWRAIEPKQVANNSDNLDTVLTLYDDTLKPNQVYYYYVRTVCIINGTKVKSSWIMIPVTTSPVGMPENLKVELGKDYSYDAKTETVISFDAPIPEDAKVPEDFEFEIAVLGSEDSDYRLDYPTKLLTSTKDHEGTPSGYTHFVYKITGLNPNTRYDIKVRIKDKTQDISDGSAYPTSSYCGPVSTRTEYDEDYEEEQEKYEEFLQKFDQEVEKLSNRDYWVVEEGTVYKYRNDYMNAQASVSNEYNLVVEDDKEATYYIPAEAFFTASENKTTFNIAIGDYSASVRPYTLTEDHEEIKEVVEQIANNKIEDYYVKVSFALNNLSGTIGGQKVLSPRMTVDMDIVYVKEDEDRIETEIEEALADLVAEERKDVIEELEKKVDKGKIDEDILGDIVSDAMEDLEKDLAKKVKRIMNNKTKKTVSVTTIDKAILLVAKVEAYAADGYYYLGDWVSVDVYSAAGGFAIEANKLGTYVITGQASLLDTVPSLAPYQSFISQYHLTDIFTLDSYMIQTAATKQQVYSAVARVLGAPRNTDSVTYLKGKNIQGISTLTMNQSVRQDETIYIMMQAYEKIYNRPVSSINIKNRQSVQNIGAFQPVYRSYIYAAVELKVVEPVDRRVIPSKQLTVEEVIKLLYKVQSF